MNHPHPLRAQQTQRASEQFGQVWPRHTNQLAHGARRIGQGSEQIESRPHAQIAPRRTGMSHRWVKRRREQKGDADAFKASCRDCGRRQNVDAKSFENIGTAALTRHRPVAVLGDAHAARRNHDRGSGRDVETPRSIATRAARVEHESGRSWNGNRIGSHRPRKPDQLAWPLAFHRQTDEQTGNLRRRGARRP